MARANASRAVAWTRSSISPFFGSAFGRVASVVSDGVGVLASAFSFGRVSVIAVLLSDGLSSGLLSSFSSTEIEVDAVDCPVSFLLSLLVLFVSRLTGSPAARRRATTSSRL